MVNVKIEGVTRNEFDRIRKIKRSALGRKTTTGETFQLIEVIHRVTPGQMNSVLRPKGFQDVTIIRPMGTNEMHIELGPAGAGALELIGDEGGEYRGELPKTEHNMRILASHYYLFRNGRRWFEYEDKALEAEVKAMADETRAKRTEKEKEIDKQLEWDMDHMPSEREPVKMRDALDGVVGKISDLPMPVDDAGKKELEKRLLEVEIEQLEAKKKALLEESKSVTIQPEQPVVSISEPEEVEPKEVPLEQMKRGAIMKLANELGITVRTTDKKEALLEKIRSKRADKTDDNLVAGESERLHETGVVGSS